MRSGSDNGGGVGCGGVSRGGVERGNDSCEGVGRESAGRVRAGREGASCGGVSCGNVEAAKRALRARLKNARAALSPDERAAADARIAAQLFELDAWRRADVVLSYLSFGSEVDTRAIIERAWAEGKAVALPRCVSGTRLMRWHRVTSLGALERSAFGVEEPPDDPATLVDPGTLAPTDTPATDDAGVAGTGAAAGAADAASTTAPAPASTRSPRALALVPGLAFDAQGFRIGYGGGFYDAFLAAFPGTSVGLCREASLLSSLRAQDALDAHDRPVDIVLTEEGETA
ncbi:MULTISPECIES: 5-formyltetrahydrofolate cyclo-ligase [unclassified Adlercreutzia]|uniref:5-formyltetrahydrofolate cyclo-ligase n=1 Tax=unclassified Adlercreutzia TaxID=2636013 RepID=UPI001F14AC56|nr:MULTISPECIES: 5-formyltetrahydrofolate cyclo-ligase [unclassified Adlercreutzia]